MRSVYLIRGNDGKYKIGIANDPKRRILQLQTGNSDELKLIAEYKSENASKIETGLHNQYSYSKQMGEWFDLSISEEVNFVKNCKRIDDAIKALKQMNNYYI